MYQTAFLVEPECVEASWFDPYCDQLEPATEGDEEELYVGPRRCLRLGCGGKGVHLVDIQYKTGPDTPAEGETAYTYRTLAPSGTAVYSTSPHITWQLDRTNPDLWIINADLDETVTITPDNANALDFSHTGIVEVIKEFDAISSVELELVMPRLGRSGEPLRLNVWIDELGDISGSIRMNSVVLAEIEGHEEPIYRWKPAADGVL
jgi:hypothetical protein